MLTRCYLRSMNPFSQTLYVIPARGGSQGIPGKNGKPLGGVPPLLRALTCARAVVRHHLVTSGQSGEAEPSPQLLDAPICLSTDSPELIALAATAGYTAPFVRPAALATAETGMHAVLLHALGWYATHRNQPFERLVLLQPTSPFRRPEHVWEAEALLQPTDEAVVSVQETRANPYYVLREEDQHGYLVPSKTHPAERRQDIPPVYELNGAVYVIHSQALHQRPLKNMSRVRKYVMDARSSHDLDTPDDWAYAEWLLETGRVTGLPVPEDAP